MNREKLGMDVAKQRLADAAERRRAGDEADVELEKLDRGARYEDQRIDKQARNAERQARVAGDETRKTTALSATLAPKPEKSKASKN
jgi:hypothetical protein